MVSKTMRAAAKAIVLGATMIMLVGPAYAAAPDNDDFADAKPIEVGIEQRVDLREATLETGETVCGSGGPRGAGGPSAWWEFTAPIAGDYVAYATGSTFDTEIGWSSNLTTTHPDGTCPDDAYDSYDAVEAPISLTDDEVAYVHLAAHSVNSRGFAGVGVAKIEEGADDFADRVTLGFAPGSSVAVQGVSFNDSFTVETGEPGCGTETYDETQWIAFTPPTSQVWYVEAKFEGETYISLYEGTSLDSLTQLTCANGTRAAVAAELTAGTTYVIQIQNEDGDAQAGVVRAEPAGSFRSHATLVDANGDGTSADVGESSAIALLPDGRPIIAYQDGDAESVRFAERAADGTWSDVLIDDDGDGTSTAMGEMIDLIVLPDGRPAVAYYDDDNEEVRWAERSAGGVWSDELIDADGDGTSTSVGDTLDIELLPDGRPVVAYYDNDNSELRLATRAADNSWSDALVDADGDGTSTDVGLLLDMVIVDGEPVIAYNDDENDEMRVAQRDGGSWIEQLVRGRELLSSWGTPIEYVGAGGHPSLRIGPDGNLHLAVQDEDTGATYYATRSANVWSVEEIHTDRLLAERGTYTWTELNFDRDGNPVIHWTDDNNASHIGVSVMTSDGWIEQIPVPHLHDPTDPSSDGDVGMLHEIFDSVVLPDGRIAYTSWDESTEDLWFVEDRYRTCSTATTPFTDVSAGSFAAMDIRCIFELEITNGTTATTYGPSDEVTREQMASFLARTYRAMTGDPCAGHPMPFDDVPDTSFAIDDIACIFALGITTGTTDTTYAPTLSVTREQMASFIARLYRLVVDPACSGGTTPFTDVPETSFASDDIPCIYGLGITTGTTPTTYSPGNAVTREQMAAFLGRTWRAPAVPLS